MKRLLAPVGLLAIFSTAAFALPDPLAAALRKCAAEKQQDKRLECFDTLVTALPKVEADSFGMTADIAHKREPAADRQQEEAVLPGKIVALSQAPTGEFIFKLDNQQVWRQTQAEPSKQFVVGEVVRIEHGAMGSWWLAADKARKTRVKRIS
jgi:hypothetical protein